MGYITDNTNLHEFLPKTSKLAQNPKKHTQPMQPQNQSQLAVQAIKDNIISEATKKMYLGTMCRLLQWLHSMHPEILSPQFIHDAALEENRQGDAALQRKFLQSSWDVRECPIQLQLLTTQCVEEFLATLITKRGKTPGKSTYGMCRSAIFHIFRVYNTPIADGYDAEMKGFFKALNKTVAKRNHDSGETLLEGKAHIEFSLYRRLCLDFLANGASSSDAIFSHAFLVRTWNLMCRVHNTVTIRVGHFNWDEDAETVQFGHMKNDQEGDRSNYARHC